MRNRAVLLVDDERPILYSLENYLERSGFYIKSAISGDKALYEFHSTSFDLVITDFVMEGMNGVELLQEIKNINFETGVFILTGHGNLSLAIEALQSGADDFLLKPCDTDLLLFRMKQFFDKQEARRKILIYEKILPICMYCKRIRDDSGRIPGTGKWLSMEEYLWHKSGVGLSHGCCPECLKVQKEQFHKRQ